MDGTSMRMNDWELLQRWAKQRSEAAFAELVKRHLDLVHGSALRQLRDPILAQDVSQAVFLVLARKASTLSPKTILSGWLFRTTRHVAARARRSESRRQLRENQASFMTLPTTAETPGDRWTEVEPHLDAAMADLAASDREALLLRYFQQKPLKSLGELLGITEEAAKKRVSRALDRLRGRLSKRGVSLTSVALAALLNEQLSASTPPSFAHDIVLVATGQATASTSTTLADGALRDLAWGRVREVLPWCAALSLMIVAGVWWFNPSLSTPSAAEPTSSPPSIDPNTPLSAAAVEPSPTASRPSAAKIVLNVRGEEDGRPLQARLIVNKWRRGAAENEEMTTDTNGIAEIAVDGSRAESLLAWVASPGYVPIVSRWRGHEFVEPVLYHTAYLRRGHTLQGEVQDEAGTSVPGARIIIGAIGIDVGERDNVSFHRRLTSIVTDAQGRFQSDQIPLPIGNLEFSYFVEHRDYVSQQVLVNSPTSLATNHLVILRPGFMVQGRVVTPEDAPAAGASITETRRDGGPYRKTQTDGAGHFEIGPFPLGEVRLSAVAEGLGTADVLVDVGPGSTNALFRLTGWTGEKTPWEVGMEAGATVRVRGSVTDAETGQSIAHFRVRLNEHRGTADGLLGFGHHGRFDWPVFMAFFEEFSLKVEAAGYEPAETDVRPVQHGEQVFEVRLRPANLITGQVLSPDGRPLAGVFIGLNGDGFGWMLLGDKPTSGNHAPQTITDAEGRFSFKPTRDAESILAVHELGCSITAVATLRNEALILHPWGAIKGVALANGKPLQGQAMSLDSAFAMEPAGTPTINLQAKTTTDAKGQFEFGKVPAGPVIVQRYHNFNRHKTGSVGFSHQHRVAVPAGGTAEVIIGDQGRTLVGRLNLSRELANHDWRDDLQSLVEAGRTEPTPAPGTAPSREFFRNLQRHWANIRRYFADIQADGSFRIEAVSPGTYVFKLRITQPAAPAKDPEISTFARPSIGQLELPVMVEDGPTDLPQDLGTITIPLE